MNMALEARRVTIGYSAGLPVVKDLDLEVRPGEIVALLGPNGAGKTTTMLALAGELPLHSGEIHIDGAVTDAPLHIRARNGLSFVTEERSVFAQLTTAENLRVGGADLDAALRLFPELESRVDIRAGLLSGGEQQMLTLARALGRSPKILLADELSLGLAPKIVTRLLDAVTRAARDQGTAVLLVEQHVSKILRFADRVYVMHRGEVVLDGDAVSMRGRMDEIEAAYMYGRGGDAASGQTPSEQAASTSS